LQITRLNGHVTVCNPDDTVAVHNLAVVAGTGRSDDSVVAVAVTLDSLLAQSRGHIDMKWEVVEAERRKVVYTMADIGIEVDEKVVEEDKIVAAEGRVVGAGMNVAVEVGAGQMVVTAKQGSNFVHWKAGRN